MLTPRTVALITAIFLAAIFRLVPHPPNFSPIAAMALFSGAYLPRRGLAFVAPLGAMLVSDAVLASTAACQSYMEALRSSWRSASSSVPSVRRAASSGRRSPAPCCSIPHQFRGLGYRRHVSEDACGPCRLLCRRDPLLPEQPCRGSLLHGLLFGGFALAQRLVPSLRSSGRIADRLSAVPVSAPPRIVSLLPSATEMIYALGLGEALVGVTTNAITRRLHEKSRGGPQRSADRDDERQPRSTPPSPSVCGKVWGFTNSTWSS
jgi:hypothetical protein